MEPINSIGKILTGNEERDCIHIAIFPAIAAETLRRGDEVGLVYGTTNLVKCMDSVYDLPAIGIVDPFLGIKRFQDEKTDYAGDKFRKYFVNVNKGERCWVFLYPGTVTGMRHHWKLPAIDSIPQPKSDSEKWLREFADKWNFDYDQMVAGAQESDGYVVARGIDLHSSEELGGEDKIFWHHIENLTGKKFDKEHMDSFGWSCTC